jgi:hypothetical protein
MTAEAETGAIQQAQATQTESVLLDLAVQTVAAKMTSVATELPPFSPTSTSTSTPTSLPSPTPVPANNCDRADFIGDLSTSADGYYYPGEVFRVVWRLQNVGSCTWTPYYQLVMVSGAFQGGVTAAMPEYIRPGQFVDFSLPLVAPLQPGSYMGYWNLKNAAGTYFGLGPDGETPLMLQATVLESGGAVSYDFADNYCLASWRSGAGMLPCLGGIDEERGLVVLMNYPVLESGVESVPGLWVHPNNSNTGWISGIYPPILVRPGDRFKTRIGCLNENPQCDVIFQVEYETVDGIVRQLGQWRQIYDGRITNINIDLSPLAGQVLKFIFTLTVQNNQPIDANGVWVYPRIEP